MTYAVVETHSVPILTGPSNKYAETGFVAEVGSHVINDIREGVGGLWGRLSSGAGWICLSEDNVKIM